MLLSVFSHIPPSIFFKDALISHRFENEENHLGVSMTSHYNMLDHVLQFDSFFTGPQIFNSVYYSF